MGDGAGGVAKVLAQAGRHVASGNFYEAQQQYRTVFHRYWAGWWDRPHPDEHAGGGAGAGRLDLTRRRREQGRGASARSTGI